MEGLGRGRGPESEGLGQSNKVVLAQLKLQFFILNSKWPLGKDVFFKEGVLPTLLLLLGLFLPRDILHTLMFGLVYPT
jgi:hypothetical protein